MSFYELNVFACSLNAYPVFVFFPLVIAPHACFEIISQLPVCLVFLQIFPPDSMWDLMGQAGNLFYDRGLYGLLILLQFVNHCFNYIYGDARCVLCH